MVWSGLGARTRFELFMRVADGAGEGYGHGSARGPGSGRRARASASLNLLLEGYSGKEIIVAALVALASY